MATMLTSFNDDKGTTLSEMLLVIAIMAMAAGLVFSHGSPEQQPTTKRLLQSFVREVQAEAMQTNRVVLLEAGNTAHSFTAGRITLALSKDQQTASRNPFGGNIITFAPDGSSSGGVLLVRYQGAEVKLAIEALTGAPEP